MGIDRYHSKQDSAESVGSRFFEQSPQECAQKLIGCRLAWKKCAGVIVETEAYGAVGDEACHTFFRPSARQFVAECDPGTAYVYLNYGVHWLLNFLVKGDKEEGFVLIRALAPTKGLGEMSRRRRGKPQTQLCSGPGKLTQALGIDGKVHGMELCSDSGLSISRPSGQPIAVPQACRRIGISRQIERKWRFLLADSPFISARPEA